MNFKDKNNPQTKSIFDSSENQCLRIIERDVMNKLNNPEESNYCTCSICRNKFELKQKGKMFLRDTSSLLKLDSSKMRTFLQYICVVNSKTYLKLEIPEIIFFQDGEPTTFFKSKNNGVHMRNMANFGVKNIVNLFVDRKKGISSTPKQIQQLAGGYAGTHLKYFQSLIPSYRHDNNDKWNKPKRYVFHNNDKLQGNKMMHLSRGSFQQICIVKYHDKGFQLLNEKQLRQVLKTSSQLKGIDFIQTYIKPKQREESFFFSDYSCFDPVENQLMMERARTHVKVEINLMTKFSKEFVPIEQLEDYETLLKDIPNEFVLYQTYKLIHYMELVRDIKVLKVNSVWIKDENREISFFGLLGFQFEENQKMTVDLQLAEIREIKESEMTDLENQLMSAWERMKKRKCNYEDPPSVDLQIQHDLESIKNESLIRKKKTSSRKGSICL